MYKILSTYYEITGARITGSNGYGAVRYGR